MQLHRGFDIGPPCTGRTPLNGWHIAIAAGLCVLLVACSRRESIFSLSPAFTAKSSISASDVADCVVQRWKNGTRRLHRGEGGTAITLRAETFFSGAAIGLRVEPEGRHTRVEYFRRRRTEPLYWSMVRGCLQPEASRETDSAPAVPQS